MIDWAVASDLPIHILLTKADKLKKGPAQNTLLAIKQELKETASVSVQLFSSLKNSGVDEARKKLNGWLVDVASDASE